MMFGRLKISFNASLFSPQMNHLWASRHSPTFSSQTKLRMHLFQLLSILTVWFTQGDQHLSSSFRLWPYEWSLCRFAVFLWTPESQPVASLWDPHGRLWSLHGRIIQRGFRIGHPYISPRLNTWDEVTRHHHSFEAFINSSRFCNSSFVRLACRSQRYIPCERNENIWRQSSILPVIRTAKLHLSSSAIVLGWRRSNDWKDSKCWFRSKFASEWPWSWLPRSLEFERRRISNHRWK